LSMDVDIWLKLMLSGARTAHISSYLGAFRWHQVSKTSRAIQDRGKRRSENPETEKLFDRAITNSTQVARWRWRTIWQVAQVVNLNYLQAWFNTRRWRGKHWQDIFCAGFVGSSVNSSDTFSL